MVRTKEELKEVFVTGAVPTQKDFHDLIDVAGEKGEPFTYDDFTPEQFEDIKGQKGDKGDKGDPGKDGFGTESQYNDIIARLEALEGK